MDAFTKIIEHIYFDADLTKDGNSLLQYFNQVSYLKLDPPAKGFTLYPPISGYSQIKRSVFRFKENPYLKFSFKEGKIIITKKIDAAGEKVRLESLWFMFDNKEQANIALNWFDTELSKVSLKKEEQGFEKKEY